MLMAGMFDEASSFNQPLNRWNVKNMPQMLEGATRFNQPLPGRRVLRGRTAAAAARGVRMVVMPCIYLAAV